MATEMSDWRPQFEAFAEALRARCAEGAETYADASFRRPPGELVGEIEEELVDVCGWAFILWSRVRELRQRAEAATQRVEGALQEYERRMERGEIAGTTRDMIELMRLKYALMEDPLPE